MSFGRLLSSEFIDCFTGEIIFDAKITKKLYEKHKVYRRDVTDALGDPYMVVLKCRQKDPPPKEGGKSISKAYEIFAETEARKVMFIVGRLFPDGNFYVVSSRWADTNEQSFYYKESEVLRDE